MFKRLENISKFSFFPSVIRFGRDVLRKMFEKNGTRLVNVNIVMKSIIELSILKVFKLILFVSINKSKVRRSIISEKLNSSTLLDTSTKFINGKEIKMNITGGNTKKIL